VTLLRSALLAFAVCALVSPGNFGTIDTVARLQVARWIRLGEPPAREFGLIGKNGRRYPWYGIGQSLVLLPFDALADATVAPVLRRAGFDAEKQRQGSETAIAFLMQGTLTTMALLLSYRLLLSFGFTPFASAAGSLSMLFATTMLQYVQSAQENLLLLVLALAALDSVRRGRFAVAGAACGFAILVRLPSLLDTALIASLALLWGAEARRFFRGFLPPVVLAVLIDRWYQWLRFGNVLGTYADLISRQLRNPDSPAGFPFSYPFWKGVLGTLFSADKSIVLFDPLLLVLLAVALWRWRAIERDVRVLLAGLAALLLAYCAFYARWYSFGGEVSWGHRFTTLPVHLLCLFAIPLLLMYGPKLLWGIVCASIVLQIASTAISPQLEYQQKFKGLGNAVIWNRAVNLAQLATGHQDPARIAGIPREWTSLYYFPFQLRFHFPALARWAIAAWLVCPVFPILLSGRILAGREGFGG